MEAGDGTAGTVLSPAKMRRNLASYCGRRTSDMKMPVVQRVLTSSKPEGHTEVNDC